MNEITEERKTNNECFQGEDCGHLIGGIMPMRGQNLRQLQALGAKPTLFGTRPDISIESAMKSYRFELRRWLGMERDSQRGREEKKQELATLVFAIFAVCIFLIAAGNTTSFKHTNEISSAGTTQSMN
jgi:hypothetical protein